MSKGKIKVQYCKTCNVEVKDPYYRRHVCGDYLEEIERPKKQISGNYIIVDWFSSRSNVGLIIQDVETGERKSIYVSDLFKHLEGTNIGTLTLEEIKKGSAYGWKVVD
jgi:nitrous oxide reductase accessory protein NosL